MKVHPFGTLPPVAALTLGGGGLGMLWGPTTFDECVATTHAAVAAGINLLDLAPRYGDGKAEEVIGAAFYGRLPDGIRVTSKCNLGEPSAAQIEGILRRSIEASLQRLRLSRLDLFFLHSNVVPDAEHIARWPKAAARMTTYRTFVDHVRPVFERLVAEGLIGAWGLTGIGHPEIIIRLLGERPAPASGAVHRQSARLAGRPQILRRARAAARGDGGGARKRGRHHGHSRRAGGGADHRDRPSPAGGSSGDARLRSRDKGFAVSASELNVNPAVLAHRYALSLAIDTLVLGVKNRQELAECVEAASGPASSRSDGPHRQVLVPGGAV